MYKPRDVVTETFAQIPVIASNYELLIEDFNRTVSPDSPEALQEVLFIGFIWGTLNAMDPGTALNTRFIVPSQALPPQESDQLELQPQEAGAAPSNVPEVEADEKKD